MHPRKLFLSTNDNIMPPNHPSCQYIYDIDNYWQLCYTIVRRENHLLYKKKRPSNAKPPHTSDRGYRLDPLASITKEIIAHDYSDTLYYSPWRTHADRCSPRHLPRHSVHHC